MTAAPHPLRFAPLVPAAVAATLGVVADRLAGGLPLFVTLGLAAGSLLAGVVAFGRGRPAFAACWLLPFTAGLFAAWHHAWRDLYPADDVGLAAAETPRLVRARGTLADEPYRPPPDPSPLRSLPPRDRASAVLRVTRLEAGDGWRAASGYARLTFPPPAEGGPHAGDAVEAVGWLSTPAGPANPGEADRASALRDRRILAELHAGSLTVTDAAGPADWSAWPSAARARGDAALRRHLPDAEAGLAVALLLGESSGLSADDWRRYVRTGVVHALAVSGQHLAVLAAFVWFWLRLAGVRRWRGAVTVALLLAAYAAVTGGRPPVLRAAVGVVAVCAAVVLRRPTVPANLFALAWLAVLVVCPADLFSPGCQLSFLAVAVLGWGVGDWLRPPPPDPAAQLVADSRPAWQRRLLFAGGWLWRAWAANAVIALAVAPVAWAWYGVVSPGALVIGPPVVALATVALVAGFGLLLADAALGGWAAVPFAAVTRWSLAGCDGLVRFADGVPGWTAYPGPLPAWWAVVFAVGLAAVLFAPLPRMAAGLAALAWLVVALALGVRTPPGELRVTFLAVGHGGCAVIEVPDGRVLVYDAGSTAGPDAASRQVAPFLWSRNVRHVDELFLSHADADHFNGVPALAERFTLGSVTTTDTFAGKESAGVALVLADLARRGVPVRQARAGDRRDYGGVTVEVLHPPAGGVPGTENARSLVLRVRHGPHTLLLTGDLEGAGMERVLALPPGRVDVLMAPHHGSAGANRPALAAWASPALVVSSQGPGDPPPARAYAERGVPALTTAEHGAVTVVSAPGGLTAETFRTGLRLAVRP